MLKHVVLNPEITALVLSFKLIDLSVSRVSDLESRPWEWLKFSH
jgi:hypothetical protein